MISNQPNYFNASTFGNEDSNRYAYCLNNPITASVGFGDDGSFPNSGMIGFQ